MRGEDRMKRGVGKVRKALKGKFSPPLGWNIELQIYAIGIGWLLLALPPSESHVRVPPHTAQVAQAFPSRLVNPMELRKGDLVLYSGDLFPTGARKLLSCPKSHSVKRKGKPTHPSAPLRHHSCILFHASYPPQIKLPQIGKGTGMVGSLWSTSKKASSFPTVTCPKDLFLSIFRSYENLKLCLASENPLDVSLDLSSGLLYFKLFLQASVFFPKPQYLF
ncbi:hypothetical protein E5676_scaffold663G00520 [Cucumis melo var. makuwa]|uniref:Uncharacterized protein n=1 Tax=Cucumis melo var. makuwa TaxID=1194695 RepID=A0A5D3CW80_CUCMM|nr:hypothetical protein E6C27_scaffold149G001310 [Cucumis melo var. makuwa]TYK14676.1 hypothetical protein E5676_scaffold663G00520 [Cucumis melo var. makuwa]